MEEYTKRVEELNDSNAFTSWITPEEDAEMILNTEKHISFDQGKAEGIEETAKNLLKADVDIAIIMNATGLTKAQIEELK